MSFGSHDGTRIGASCVSIIRLWSGGHGIAILPQTASLAHKVTIDAARTE